MATFHGKLLKVDLSAGSTEDMEISPEVIRKYLGGLGLAAHLYLTGYDTDADPLSPSNPLFIMAGPLTGTQFPGTGRFVVCANSPLTGIFGYGNSGGRFGPELKFSGYDGIVVEGAADKPVCLLIDDGEARIEDAADLWGQNIWDCEEKLLERYEGERKVQVISIGPAGENRVRFANIGHDKGEFVGRCGMGAVMGSKNLKAVAVRGSWRPSAASEEEFKTIMKDARETVNKNPLAGALKAMGTNVGYAGGLNGGDVPIKNWALGEHKEAMDSLSAMNYTKNYLTRGSACYSCPIACKRHVAVKEGKYKTEEIPGPEYETVAMFGSMIFNHDLEAVIEANRLCNQLGMDSISCGSTIAHAMEMWEKEIIGKGDTDGLELTWGNMDAALKLVDRIAKREGFGDVLAEGSERVAEKIGDGSDKFLTTIKGMESPAHDPRCYHGMGIAYAMSPRGACHTKHLELYSEMGMYRHKSLGMDGDTMPMSSEGKARRVSIGEDVGALNESAVICSFAQVSIQPEQFLEGLRSATGFDYSLEEMHNMGRRVMVLHRGITNLQGVSSKDDRLPERILTPPPSGPHKDSKIDMDLMLKEYYEARGLGEDGRPTPEICKELELEELEKRLYG